MKTEHAHAIPAQWTGIARLFTALGDEQRQRILLLFEADEWLNVSEIVAAMPLSRSAVAHHLRVLREAGILGDERVGRETRYHLNATTLADTLEKVAAYIRQHLTSPKP